MLKVECGNPTECSNFINQFTPSSWWGKKIALTFKFAIQKQFFARWTRSREEDKHSSSGIDKGQKFEFKQRLYQQNNNCSVLHRESCKQERREQISAAPVAKTSVRSFNNIVPKGKTRGRRKGGRRRGLSQAEVHKSAGNSVGRVAHYSSVCQKFIFFKFAGRSAAGSYLPLRRFG